MPSPPQRINRDLFKTEFVLFLSGCLSLTTAPGAFAGQADQSEAPPPVQAAQQTPAQLQQLVAPIALYADALVAQVLAAATYPDQIVEAKPVDCNNTPT